MHWYRSRQFWSVTAMSMVVGGLLAEPRAAADITAANWVSNTLFNYRVQHMPDIDQRRASLPCGGSIHCVPTCASNMVMYAANHGFPSLSPGPGYWEGNTNYITASNTVLLMGAAMGTSCAAGGTSGGPANNGLNNWINVLSNVDGLIVNDHLALGSFSPTHASIGKSLCAGRVGSVSYGRYVVSGTIDGIPVVTRDGGHCTTAVKVRRNGASRDLWVRNPASDEGDPTSQSPFVNDVWTVTDITVIILPNMTQKTMTAINYTPGDSVIQLIDGHRTITPAQGYSWDSSLGAVVFVGSQNFVNPTPLPTHFPPPVGTAVASLAWHGATDELLVVCTGPTILPSLRTIDPQTNASELIATPLVPTLVATGRSDNIYVSDGNAIAMLLRPAPPNAPPMTPRTLPNVAHAMAYDDARDDLVLVSRTDRKLMRIARTLAGVISVQDIPTFVPMGTRIQVSINPSENGVVYLWSDASNQIWRLAAGAGGLSALAINLPAAPQPQSVDFSTIGHMLVSNNGTLVEFEPVPVEGGGGWQVDATSAFAGLPAGRDFRIMRTRTNFEPGVHDVPGWTTNIDPALLPSFPTAPDCAADIAPNLNIDNVVNVADLLAVITAWGPCASSVRCVADIDDDHAVGVSDLLAVITAWGPCP